MHQPADVDSELDGLRTGQQHAEVEGVQVTVLGYPASALDQFLMHHRDLSGRAAKADEAELEPIFEGFSRVWVAGGGVLSEVCCCDVSMYSSLEYPISEQALDEGSS